MRRSARVETAAGVDGLLLTAPRLPESRDRHREGLASPTPLSVPHRPGRRFRPTRIGDGVPLYWAGAVGTAARLAPSIHSLATLGLIGSLRHSTKIWPAFIQQAVVVRTALPGSRRSTLSPAVTA